MNSAEDVVQWRQDHAIWICAGALLLCVSALIRVPGWWRGRFNSGLSLGRQRTYLVQWVGSTFLMFSGLIGAYTPGSDQMTKARSGFVLLFAAVGILFLLLIPLVWHLRAFEFLVAPGLRRDVPGGPPDFGQGRPLSAAAAARKRRAPVRNASRRAPVRNAAATGADGSGALRFERPRAVWRDRFVRYGVELDGNEVSTLRPGTDFTVPVAAGTHTVRGAIQGTGSPTVNVRVRAGETTVVRIRPATGNPLLQIAASDTYLEIEVADT